MNTVENTVETDDVYDSDDVGLRSPLLKPYKPNLEPSPSPPPAVPLPQVSPEPSPSGRKGSNRSKNRPSQGDAVLVSFMDGGKRPDIAAKAGMSPLPSDDESSDDSVKGTKVNLRRTKDKESEHEGQFENEKEIEKEKEKEPEVRSPEHDLAALAVSALNVVHEANNAQEKSIEAVPEPAIQKENSTSTKARPMDGEPMEDVKLTIAPMTTDQIGAPRVPPSPETAIKLEHPQRSGAGELPPIQPLSPQAGVNGNGAGPVTLPTLKDQFGDINHLGEAAAANGVPVPQSPQVPGGPPRFTAVAPGPGSPTQPLSPNTFRRELPSPGRPTVGGPFSNYATANYRRPSQSEGSSTYVSSSDYSSHNTETPSTDHSASTPAIGIDRMSIDGITNPQIGGFQCTYPGCTAQPFQTQYLLNSHANVHSSNRPHYCQVKGCPRSEGGKGFKRKNEMIRHGLVHDSPGYVCPFCPDREHKYPRPDNLQRHVRVHHMDKDKDDPQLREVLAQRPEGPSRGRRRRGTAS